MTGGDGLGAALELLERAQGTLLESCRADSTTDRYIQAHLGALRAAAALLAVRPRGRGRAIRTVWSHLGGVAPELAEWGDYFAVCGTRRALVEAGAVPSRREADDLLRSAETFLALVQAALGMPVTCRQTGLAAVGAP